MTVFIMFLSRFDRLTPLPSFGLILHTEELIHPGLSREGSDREGVDVFAMAFPRALVGLSSQCQLWGFYFTGKHCLS